MAASQASIWSVEQRTPFNEKVQHSEPLDYSPLVKALHPWKICVLVPHLKDAYWIGIDYGLVEQANTLGVSLELFEAGSYYGQKKQLSQLSYCMQEDYDAILLGSVNPKLLSSFHAPITKPLIALVNRIDSFKVATRIGVNWYQMGWHAGHYIKQDAENANRKKANVALLTGPEKQGGSDWVEQGITAALNAESIDKHIKKSAPKPIQITQETALQLAVKAEKSTIRISSIRHADNNRNLYRDQLHHLLNDQTPDYILGSAVAIEAAIGELSFRSANVEETRPSVKLVSSYLSPSVFRGLFRHKVAFSNDDLVVLQGKLAIDVTVRELEGAKAFGDIGPKIQGLYGDVLEQHQGEKSLAPADFYPIYRVKAEL